MTHQYDHQTASERTLERLTMEPTIATVHDSRLPKTPVETDAEGHTRQQAKAAAPALIRHQSQSQQPREASERDRPWSASTRPTAATVADPAVVQTSSSRSPHRRNMSIATTSLPRRPKARTATAHRRSNSDSSSPDAARASPVHAKQQRSAGPSRSPLGGSHLSLDRMAGLRASGSGHGRKSSVVSIEGFLGDTTDDVAPSRLPTAFYGQLPAASGASIPNTMQHRGLPSQFVPSATSPFGTLKWDHLDKVADMQRRGSLQRQQMELSAGTAETQQMNGPLASTLEHAVQTLSTHLASSTITEESPVTEARSASPAQEVYSNTDNETSHAPVQLLPHTSSLDPMDEQQDTKHQRRGSFFKKCAVLFTKKTTASLKTSKTTLVN